MLLLHFFSDLKIKIDGKEIHGHRFVLAARSDRWGVSDLSQVAVLDLSGEPCKDELMTFIVTNVFVVYAVSKLLFNMDLINYIMVIVK